MLTSLLILSASSSARIRPALPVVASIAKTLFFRELSPTELTLLEVGEVGIFLAEAGLGNSSKPLSCVTLESCVCECACVCECVVVGVISNIR